MTDINHPKYDTTTDREFYSERLGTWLSSGFDLIVIAILIFCVMVPALSLYGNILTVSTLFQGATLPDLTQEDPIILQIAVYVLTVSTTSIIAFGNRLNKVSLGIRSILDTILDVDNYLRLYPQDDTPRAQIFARYISLLRYLYHWRDPQDNQPYDGIIIISHSQGTVITADLLRLLSVDSDSSLERSQHQPSVYVFYDGFRRSKQLYGFTFRDLYQWISNNPKQLSQTTPQMLKNGSTPIAVETTSDVIYGGRKVVTHSQTSSPWQTVSERAD